MPQTRTYRLNFRNSIGVRDAIQQLAPAAVVVSDRFSQMLLVTASEADQERIAQVIEQMSRADADQRVTKAYHLEVADVSAAEDALRALLSGARVGPASVRSSSMPKLSLVKLERHLYSAADRFRQGSLDAATYKDYIFGMLFLKRCSNVFDAEQERIVGRKVEHVLDGGGDYFFIRPESEGSTQLGETIYFWDHETGELNKVADAFEELSGGPKRTNGSS